jgi:hypothetical protein
MLSVRHSMRGDDGRAAVTTSEFDDVAAHLLSPEESLDAHRIGADPDDPGSDYRAGDVGVDLGVAPAEEAAMHVIDTDGDDDDDADGRA